MSNQRQSVSVGEGLTAACFGVSMLAAIALGIVYWRGGQSQLEGLFLAVALGGIGIGIIVWAKHYMPPEEITEERHSLASSDEERAAFWGEVERGEEELSRRGLLLKMAGASVAFLGAALLFPIRSLGPRPGRGFKNTPYHDGVRLVNDLNQPILASDVGVNSVITAFPENHTDAADGSTLLIHPDAKVKPRPGRATWTPNGLVAYSKLCTHVGCPVGLYQAGEHLLLCPCHQSTFAVLEAAKPIFGPAARALPQLPLRIDGDGYVVAKGDFSGPVGPGFWDRDRK